jgi:hypothetical protein
LSTYFSWSIQRFFEKFRRSGKALTIERKHIKVDDAGSGGEILTKQQNALEALRETSPLVNLDLLPERPWFTNHLVESIFRCAKQISELEDNQLPYDAIYPTTYWSLLQGNLTLEQTLFAIDYDQDPGKWVAQRLLTPAIFEHLLEIPAPGSANEHHARRLLGR